MKWNEMKRPQHRDMSETCITSRPSVAEFCAVTSRTFLELSSG